MKRETVSGFMITLIVVSVLTLEFNLQPVEASGTIYIRADGSVEGTTHITSVDNITYNFTDNIYDSIVVERSNIIIDGDRHTLQGSGSGNGFYLAGTINVTIQNTNIKGFDYGIQIFLGQQNTISGNNITANGIAGIWINFYSNYNSISGNNITANEYYGISLYCSSFNTIIGNNITEPRDGLDPIPYGIFLEEDSGNNIISGNSIIGLCLKGIWNEGSSHNTISGNTITSNVADPGDWDPYYSFDGIHLVSSSYITISLNNITANHFGIWIQRAGSNYNTISGNNITKNSYGILLNEYWWSGQPSNNTIISGNNITANHWCGIDAYQSYSNIIRNNNIRNTVYYGIRLSSRCSNNSIVENTIANNKPGIEASNPGNRFYHNNLINNVPQVYPTNYNTWDDGYPSGGNYWSDYTGADLSWGAYQNKTGSDGIGDSPYIIDGNTADHYPLMSPYEYWSDPILGDINKDMKVDHEDLSQLTTPYGSTPEKPNWNPNSDFNGDDTVDVLDLFDLSKNYGKTEQT